MSKVCFFCDIQKENEDWITQSDNFFVRLDDFPVSKGHCEVIPKKHITSLFELEDRYSEELFNLIKKAKNILDKDYSPDGYNIGLNEGRAAGRSIDHLHIHIIPRYKGDIDNPEGGIRNIIAGKGKYVSRAKNIKGHQKYFN